MPPHLLQWFHKKAPKLRQQGALQISRRRDDVRLMMNARSRWWWCWYSTPKMKRNREEEGKHVWASQLQRPPLVNFSSTDNGLHIIIYYTHTAIRGQRATEDFSSVRQHSAKAAAENSWRLTLDSITLTTLRFFTSQKAKGGNPPTVYWQVRHLVTLTAICFYLFSFESVVF